MGLTLTNEQIDQTYAGLIKMNDNVAVTAVLKPLSDGIGQDLPIEISTTGVNFTGTVTGIPTPPVVPNGLESGAGADSMQSSSALTTIPANASATTSIALGNDARGGGNRSIAIGNNAIAGTSMTQNYNIAIGNQTQANDGTVSIGNQINGGSALSSVFIGNNAGGASRSVGIGRLAVGSGDSAIAIGNQANATAAKAVAIGDSVTASTAFTVSVKELETQTVGGGITMYSPNGTGYKLTVSDAGAPVFTAI